MVMIFDIAADQQELPIHKPRRPMQNIYDRDFWSIQENEIESPGLQSERKAAGWSGYFIDGSLTFILDRRLGWQGWISELPNLWTMMGRGVQVIRLTNFGFCETINRPATLLNPVYIAESGPTLSYFLTYRARWGRIPFVSDELSFTKMSPIPAYVALFWLLGDLSWRLLIRHWLSDKAISYSPY